MKRPLFQEKIHEEILGRQKKNYCEDLSPEDNFPASPKLEQFIATIPASMAL